MFVERIIMASPPLAIYVYIMNKRGRLVWVLGFTCDRMVHDYAPFDVYQAAHTGPGGFLVTLMVYFAFTPCRSRTLMKNPSRWVSSGPTISILSLRKFPTNYGCSTYPHVPPTITIVLFPKVTMMAEEIDGYPNSMDPSPVIVDSSPRSIGKTTSPILPCGKILH